MRRLLFLLVAAGAVAWVALRRAGAFRVAVEGPSMAPALLPGEYLVAVRPTRLRRGDVVVVRRPEREVVKRVASVPGENGLGPDQYLVVGDNRAASTDSRSFGPVSREDIVGVVRYRYWPEPGRVR